MVKGAFESASFLVLSEVNFYIKLCNYYGLKWYIIFFMGGMTNYEK